MKYLSCNEVHVWRQNICNHLRLASEYNKFLSLEEQRRAKSFAFPYLTRHYVVRRTLLRIILSQYLDIEPNDIVFTTYLKGKPCLDSFKHNLYFNLSYSHDLVYYVVARQPNIGIDIEYILEDYNCDIVIDQILHSEEHFWYKSLHSHTKIEAFYKVWTQKEAIIKAMGIGMYYPLSQINLQTTPWNLSEIETTQNYLGFIATQHKVETINSYSWQ